MSEKEIALFDAPDLAALQRNWPRIALRGGVLVLVPLCVALLARSLDLYPTIARLPLPLDFLDVGPFAYEGKVIFAIVATLLALAFLMPKRTAALVMAVCVGSVLWTGHVYITLQWARLFATRFAFRADAAPDPLAWLFASLLLAIGVVFLLMENLLDTRAQQEARALPVEQTRALFDVAWRTLVLVAGIGAGVALALILVYAGVRALLQGARLPFRLNPVFVLFGMGICLAVLIAVAARKRSPVERAAWMDTIPAPTPAPAPTPVARPAAAPETATEGGFWRRMRRAERVAFVLAILSMLALVLPLKRAMRGFGFYVDVPAFQTGAGALILVASLATVVLYVSRDRGNMRRFGPIASWVIALVGLVMAFADFQRGTAVPSVGTPVSSLLALAALSATLLAARREPT